MEELIYKILSLLHKEGIIRIIKVNGGIIVKDDKEDKVLLYIGEDLLNDSINDIVDEIRDGIIFPQSKETILKTLREILFKNIKQSKVIQKEYFLLAQSIEDLLNNLSLQKDNLPKTSQKIPNLNGKIVYQIQEKDRRIILLKDFKPTDRIYYEAPMIENLKKLWRGKTIHRNFAIVEVIKQKVNILCEFDAIGVLDDILCIFEIKNKQTKNVPRFLFNFFKYAPYILEWLKKNQYKINYVAPILYLREKTDYKNIKLNIIYYHDILENKEIKINILYQNFDGRIFESGKILKDIVLTKKSVESVSKKEKDNNKKENDNIVLNISFPKNCYEDIKTMVVEGFFQSEEDFIIFAVKNMLNIIKPLKNIKKQG
ncbi:conserved hypothetical protein [Methanocaldococcus vulcanius M7]|uniref:Uncharacterized protein n=1 Tax=Methanocaldococcus vulcanius (strain ATCC 700851 / DSM 12094 / M7) TaxID=579137 RepID=C9RDU7_METVM|nr:hypothetical protein [Methanocaldococcus vulcanius]ACX73476.1 conserved hypothetical protein [Methanocaldococcus vulcanius M7]